MFGETTCDECRGGGGGGIVGFRGGKGGSGDCVWRARDGITGCGSCDLARLMNGFVLDVLGGGMTGFGGTDGAFVTGGGRGGAWTRIGVEVSMSGSGASDGATSRDVLRESVGVGMGFRLGAGDSGTADFGRASSGCAGRYGQRRMHGRGKTGGRRARSTPCCVQTVRSWLEGIADFTRL